jgi:hypothetical protein
VTQHSARVRAGLGAAAMVVALLGVVGVAVKGPDGDRATATASGPDLAQDDGRARTADDRSAPDTTAPSTTETTAAPATTATTAAPASPAADPELEAFLAWLPDGTAATLELGRTMLRAQDVRSPDAMGDLCAEVEGMLPETREVAAANPVASIREPTLDALDHLAQATRLCQQGVATDSFELMDDAVAEFETGAQLLEQAQAAMESYMAEHGLTPPELPL